MTWTITVPALSPALILTVLLVLFALYVIIGAAVGAFCLWALSDQRKWECLFALIPGWTLGALALLAARWAWGFV